MKEPRDRHRHLVVELTIKDSDKPDHPGWTTMVLVRRDLLDGGPRRGDAIQDAELARLSRAFVTLYQGWHDGTPEEDHIDPVEAMRRIVEGPNEKGEFG